MNQRIEICSIQQKQIDNVLEVTFELLIKGNAHSLTYKISGGITEVPEICDAIVVTFLGYAVMHNLDFCSTYPITKKLYYHLVKHVIPHLAFSNKTADTPIKIEMPLTDEVYCGKWVGTGISMGVDSFTSIHEYMEDCILDEYKLTHLVHLKTGAHHGNLGYFDKEKEHELFLLENAKVKQYCEENGFDLVVIESNLFEITNAEFGYNFDTTHAFRNLGCILLVQNYFNKYYYASGSNMDKFHLSLRGAMAYYDKWLLPYISNDSLMLYSSNESKTRIQKTKYIAKYPDTYSKLHVCWRATDNCGRCAKCIRTLVTLDVLGELDKYTACFDVQYYIKHRNVHIAEVVLLRNKDLEYMEIYKYMREHGVKMPSTLTMCKAAIGLVYMKFAEHGLSGFVKRVKNKFFR